MAEVADVEHVSPWPPCYSSVELHLHGSLLAVPKARIRSRSAQRSMQQQQMVSGAARTCTGLSKQYFQTVDSCMFKDLAPCETQPLWQDGTNSCTALKLLVMTTANIHTGASWQIMPSRFECLCMSSGKNLTLGSIL